ncbi:MAG: hypothetical protein MMC33_001828 [Icmadophila ericetorum]|nr:hypothetical protein [Icmadophila ericetorum]
MINRPSPDYGFDVTHVNGYIDSRGLNYNCTSTNSSPSPVILYSNVDHGYDPFSGDMSSYPDLQTQPASPLVEFTDLTVPYQDDRRRRRSNVTRDKQTISTMHMRRRAQNRASQRAFRERKEKHAQNLQKQLDELEAKHQGLLASYEKLDTTNSRLEKELQQIREKMRVIQTSRTETLDELVESGLFESFEFEDGHEARVQG